MKAACKYYRKCSGCTRLADPYVRQLFVKKRAIDERFARFQLRDGVVEQIKASPSPFGYRSSVKHALHEDQAGQRAIGLFKFGTKLVVDIPDCPVQLPAINKLLKRMFDERVQLPAPFYNHAKRGFQPGRLKFVTIRHSDQTRQSGVVISHTGVQREALVRWIESLRLRDVSVVEAEITKEDKDLIVSERFRHLAGPETFAFRLAGMEFALSPLAFFQANAALADEFVAAIAPEDEGGARLLDLYGGFGAYSFVAAKRFGALEVVDGNKAAIQAAQANAAQLGVANLKATHASIEDFLERRYAPRARQETTHLIVNPPRAGLSQHVQEKLKTSLWPQAEKLTYVSCNVDTLTRDLAFLVRRQGWKIERVQPFDMFPQTEHIELVVKLVPA